MGPGFQGLAPMIPGMVLWLHGPHGPMLGVDVFSWPCGVMVYGRDSPQRLKFIFHSPWAGGDTIGCMVGMVQTLVP